MHKHTIKLLNILAVLGLSHLVVLYTAVIQNTANEPLNYHPDGPFWLALQCFLAQYITFKCYQHSSALKLTSSNSLIKVYLNSSAIFILTNTGLVLGLEWFIGLNPLDYRHGLLTMLLSFLLHLLIGGALMSFLFFNEAQKQHLAHSQTQNLLAKSQISALQQQLDPHFLFNNLNVLSALIQQDPDEADDFLDEFCSLYRHMLETNKSQFVSLGKELEFAVTYMTLLNKRFPNAYVLKINLTQNSTAFLIISGALQLALENVVKHNQAHQHQPIVININLQDDYLIISNNRQDKYQNKHPNSLHIGLHNLKERCQLLFGKSINIEQDSNTFSLSIPMQANHKDDTFLATECTR
ncbi:hypothetical protein G3485_06765 [Shewanella baltica]|uniref:sensor histidine kinase n=1 Tax=Shewanella baltica TaxID=62322 RepID=UPI00217E3EA1|nr:histidine kinase [Shewanella baltica]MCS6126827.1 hypothetical protein [Shewanella baltica]MCS6138900.1 hypothetical protein [Shewanella baltica]MCS6145089.1 hypothetical protein [Shewanella baltica]MCS6169619.1 hypothetical protein [Shewanella baltica]MCS6186843.1 hypothetical protein [Shewanella baltica]